MKWQEYSIFFDTLFISLPFLLTVFLSADPKPVGEAAVDLRRKIIYLLFATLCCLAIMLMAHKFYKGSGNLALWVFFFPLWFLGAMRILPLKRPNWFANVHQDSTIRTAKLSSRLVTSPIPLIAWVIVWLLPVVSVFFILIDIDDYTDMTNLMPLFMLGGAFFWAGIGSYGTRWFLTEAEPMDRYNSAELTAAYEKLRKVKLWGWFAVVAAATSIFCIVALTTTYKVGLTTIVWIGGGGGSAVGIFGGIFGTYCTVLRGRVNELRIKLDRQRD